MRPDSDNSLALPTRSGAALILYPLGHLAVEIYNGMLFIMWPVLTARFGLTYSLIGLLTMLFRGGMTLPQLGFASLVDRHGGRLLAVWGLAWMALGMSLVGIVPSVALLVIILTLAPLGSAAFHPAATAHMSRALPRRRGTAVAFLMVGGSIGMSLGPIVGAWLCERPGISASPGLIPIGLAIALLMYWLIPADGQRAGQQVANARPVGPIPAPVFLLMVAVIGQAWIESAIGAYLPLLLTERGVSLGLASRVFFAMSAAACAGLFVGGALSDRMPRWRVIVLAEAFTVPCYIGAVLLRGQGVLVATAGLGFVSALSQPTAVAMGQELMPERLSLASALTMGISWVIGSLGAALTGILADHLGMQTALLANAGLPLLGMGCMLMAWRLGQRQGIAKTDPNWIGRVCERRAQ